MQVLQACAVRLAEDRGCKPGGLTQAFLLPTVCRCALSAGQQRGRPAACMTLCSALAASGRRFKEALEQPFWSTLDEDLAARLWRALGQHGALRPWLV